jgi:hypothetical protein
MGDQPNNKLLTIQDSKTQKDKDKHPCCKWDSNPHSQHPSNQGESDDYDDVDMKVIVILSLKLQGKQRKLCVICLVNQRVQVTRNKTAMMIKVRFMQLGGLQHSKTKSLLSTYKFFGENSGVKQIPTNCISVSEGLPGDTRKHMIEKINWLWPSKGKYSARKCINEKLKSPS